MAILNGEALAQIRQASTFGIVDYTKPQINSGIQAIEDWFETNRVGISSAIDIATSPLVLTNPQKKRIVKYWLNHKFGVE